MNEDQEKESNPTAAPIPPKAEVSKNEAISQSVYPDPDKPKPIEEPMATSIANTQSERFSLASAAMDEALTLASGAAAVMSYLFISYFVKNYWLTAAVSAGLAIFAIYFATRNYNRSGKMGPLTVVGLAAATIALVYVVSTLLLQAMIHARASNYGY